MNIYKKLKCLPGTCSVTMECLAGVSLLSLAVALGLVTARVGLALSHTIVKAVVRVGGLQVARMLSVKKLRKSKYKGSKRVTVRTTSP